MDMEHGQALQNAQERLEHKEYCAHVAKRLEKTSKDECVVRGYTDITREWLDSKAIRALIISGNRTDWASYDQENLRKLGQIIRFTRLPILGICGGLQFIAMTYGAHLGPIRRLKEGEKDPRGDFAPGYFKEWDFTQVEVLKSDPLFDGLEDPTFLEAHYWELKEIPKGFQLLASTDDCRIQAIKRIGKLIYGTQFHPEAYIAKRADSHNRLINRVYPEGYSKRQSDGRKLLVNFFRLAGIRNH